MKIHNKGQVVIPSHVRRLLHIEIGDLVEVSVDAPRRRIRLGKPRPPRRNPLAGSLSRYKAPPFPSRSRMNDALARGLAGE
jgi:AbrB family looped-hinge helix DNA binding protein